MLTIIEALKVEHSVFVTVFDQIDSLLPELRTLAEVKNLAALVEGLLQGHADTEENLAYAALDHVLQDQGMLSRLYQDHQEIDGHLLKVKSARNLAAARRLLHAALLASRRHFRHEEQSIFPLIENMFQSGTLAELGRTCMDQHLTTVTN